MRTDSCIAEQMNRHGDMVYRLGLLYLKNEQDAQDIFQEVFLRLFEKDPVFASEEHLKAWLITVTTNCCKNLLRTVWYRRTVPLDELRETVADEEQADMISRLFCLPLKYRQVLYLYYYEGYSTEEISSMLHIKSATVRTQLKRGRELLKIQIMEDTEDERSFQRV